MRAACVSLNAIWPPLVYSIITQILNNTMQIISDVWDHFPSKMRYHFLAVFIPPPAKKKKKVTFYFPSAIFLDLSHVYFFQTFKSYIN